MNKQSIFKSFVFHAVLIAASAVVAFFYPFSGYALAWGVPFMVIGVVMTAVQYNGDAEESLLPYCLTAIGTIVFWFITATNV